MFLADTTLTVIHRGEVGRDRLNKPILGEVSRESVEGCRLEQRGSQEGAEYVVGKWIAYMPPAVELDSDDTLSDGVRTFAIDGAPAPQHIPGFPFMDHLLVNLTLIGG